MLKYQLLENMKIDYNPIVLVNTLFNIVKYKTNIRGYWIDKGKLYIDNVKCIEYFAINTLSFLAHKRQLFLSGQKCVFYKDIYNQGVLEYPNGTWEVLKKRKQIIYTCKPCQLDIELLLKKYEGLTIYKIDTGQYLIEIYT